MFSVFFCFFSKTNRKHFSEHGDELLRLRSMMVSALTHHGPDTPTFSLLQVSVYLYRHDFRGKNDELCEKKKKNFEK